MTNYYSLNISDTIKSTGTSQKGLSVDESVRKLKECGINDQKQNKKISPLRILIRQFTSSIVFTLLTALAVAAIPFLYITMNEEMYFSCMKNFNN